MRAILLTVACLSLTAPAFAQSGAAREQRPAATSRISPAQPGGATPVQTSATPAPTPSEPQSTTATFGDWVLRCQRAGDEAKPQKICEVVQSIQAQGQTAPLAQIAIGRRAEGEPLRVTALLPPNVTFPSTVTVATDEKDTQPLQLVWRRCIPGGCFADAELGGDTLNRWRGQGEGGRATFTDAAGRSIALPLSFRGLAQALDALGKA